MRRPTPKPRAVYTGRVMDAARLERALRVVRKLIEAGRRKREGKPT